MILNSSSGLILPGGDFYWLTLSLMHMNVFRVIKGPNFIAFCLAACLLLFSIDSAMAQSKLDVQGHRGCRGLMPENTIPAMKKALDLGVTTLELDVVISKDRKVVVSHDPYFESDFSLTPEGKEIKPSEEKKYLIYQMEYAQVKTYDVGRKPYPKFPRQKKISLYKPLLSELIDSVESYVERKGLPAPYYNIEIKSEPAKDNVYQPEPEEFVSLVMEVIDQKDLRSRVIVQSFDRRPLQVLHQKYARVRLAYLVVNLKAVQANVKKLGFTPDVYSPYYKMVKKKTVNKCHRMGMKIIPWTVNSKDEIHKLSGWGVDGIITDYPDLFYH